MDRKITNSKPLSLIESNIIAALKGNQFWGDIEITRDEYEILERKLNRVLQSEEYAVRNLCSSYPCVVTTFLVFFARYRYDVNFWGVLCEKLGIPVSLSNETQMGECARRTFLKYGFDFSAVKGERRVNLEPILYEAGIPPESSMDDLFYVLSDDLSRVFDPRLVIDDLLEKRSYSMRKPLLKFLQRCSEDRAVKFLIGVRDAVMSAEQGMVTDSPFVEQYTKWKIQENTKEGREKRKNSEIQAVPYLVFENGQRGLCLVLPKVIIGSEWIEEAEWTIEPYGGTTVHRPMSVFGENGRRLVYSTTVPVCPAVSYRVKFNYEDSLEDNAGRSWEIRGIPNDGVLLFNADGRAVAPRNIPAPFGTLILGPRAEVQDSSALQLTRQYYPTDLESYSTYLLEPFGAGAKLSFWSEGRENAMFSRPQINIFFSGSTLLSLPAGEYPYFTDVPELILAAEDAPVAAELEIRLGDRKISGEILFKDGGLRLALSGYMENKAGRYSVRLFQGEHFLKQADFCIVPTIKSTYIPALKWARDRREENRRAITFERGEDYELVFPDCASFADETSVTVEYPVEKGAVPVVLNVELGQGHTLSCPMELPIRPAEVKLIIPDGEETERENKRIGLGELVNHGCWTSLKTFGQFRDTSLSLRLCSVNGYEQIENVSGIRNGQAMVNLSCFFDTLRSCPLPARIELWAEGQSDGLAILTVTDTAEFSARPRYIAKRNWVVFSDRDKANDIFITRFGRSRKEYYLPFSSSKSVASTKGKTWRVYKLKEQLEDGLYLVEGRKTQSDLFFEEEENTACLTNGNEILYISHFEGDETVDDFSGWLDAFIGEIVSCGVSKDPREKKSWQFLSRLEELVAELTEDDYEKLIALGYFADSKCSDVKRSALLTAMETISASVLVGRDRACLLELLTILKCPQSVFDLCSAEYDLYLAEAKPEEAERMAGDLEPYSAEFSLLIRMRAGEPLRNTFGRKKYINLLGIDAFKYMMDVPDAVSAAEIAAEQRKYCREESSKVQIRLTKDISGDYVQIQDRIRSNKYGIYLDLAAKSDSGLYFYGMRFTDQYLSWFGENYLQSKMAWNMKESTEKKLLVNAQENAAAIVKYIRKLKRATSLGNIVNVYESALRGRFDGDPLRDMNIAIPARNFYLQGMAALIALLPCLDSNCTKERAAAVRFLMAQTKLAPQMTKRDIMMAATYLYLIGKEKKLCR